MCSLPEANSLLERMEAAQTRAGVFDSPFDPPAAGMGNNYAAYIS
jgi:hypothetical protein